MELDDADMGGDVKGCGDPIALGAAILHGRRRSWGLPHGGALYSAFLPSAMLVDDPMEDVKRHVDRRRHR
jgi:hypothetical protein